MQIRVLPSLALAYGLTSFAISASAQQPCKNTPLAPGYAPIEKPVENVPQRIPLPDDWIRADSAVRLMIETGRLLRDTTTIPRGLPCGCPPGPVASAALLSRRHG